MDYLLTILFITFFIKHFKYLVGCINFKTIHALRLKYKIKRFQLNVLIDIILTLITYNRIDRYNL